MLDREPLIYVMAFHPGVFIYYWFLGNREAFTTVYQVFAFLLMLCSTWLFILSQFFQKPILFDTYTENNRKDNLTQLAEAIEYQTQIMAELINSLKPKDNESSEGNGEAQKSVQLR